MAPLLLGSFVALASRASAQSAGFRPVLLQSARTDVVLTVPAREDLAAETARLSKLIAGCRRSMTIAAADSAAFVTARPDAWRTPAATASTVVWFSVMPSEGLQADCGDRSTQSGLAAARGIRLGFDTTYARDRDLQRVIMKRGEDEIAPIETQRLLVRRLGANGFGEPRAGWFRIAIDIGEFAPLVDGQRDDVTIEVYTLGGVDPDRFVLPWTMIREGWEALYGERAAATSTVASAPLALAEPGDEVLHEAYEAYRSGDLRASVRLAAPRLESPNLTRADALQGRVQVGLALAALGDTAAARAAFSKLVEREPCFTLSSTAPEAARALVDGLARPAARCKTQSAWRTGARAALLPGFGQPSQGAALTPRVAIASIVVVGVGYGIISGSEARTKYDDYLAYQYFPNELGGFVADDLYRQAESVRVRGKAFWTLAGVAWGGQFVYALWNERRFGKRLAEVQNYGGGRRNVQLDIRPLLTPAATGVTLSLTW
jgi:hypothetical protein